MVRDPLRRIGAATPGRGSDRAQATPQPAATVMVGGQLPDQSQVPEQVGVAEQVGVCDNAARAENAARADQSDGLEVAEDAAPPEAVPLLEPRDGMPPLVASAAALDEAVRMLGAGEGPVAVDAERASGFRYGHRAFLV